MSMTPTDSVLEELDARVLPARKLIVDAYRQKAISKDAYHKAMVQIAYEYAVAGYPTETLGVLMLVEPAYFRNLSAAHMHQDETFCKQARVVAEVLMTTNILPTQKAANA